MQDIFKQAKHAVQYSIDNLDGPLDLELLDTLAELNRVRYTEGLSIAPSISELMFKLCELIVNVRRDPDSVDIDQQLTQLKQDLIDL